MPERTQPGMAGHALAPLSLHHNCQVHAGMDGAVELERSSRGERTNGLRTVAVDLHLLDLRCARLAGGVCRAVVPGSISDNVWCQCIINQCETLPLLDRDGCLVKLCVVHMDGIPCCTGSGAGSAAGYQEKGDDTTQCQSDNQCSEHALSSLYYLPA